eukprot:XP_003729152.1 PREDICTED: uncharacterized protein LOC100889568 [Strongylocentrotus purpuratus]
MPESEATAQLKLKRRGAKAKLTRCGNAVEQLISKKASMEAVEERFHHLKIVYEELQEKHESYSELIFDDDQFEKEEKWMEVCDTSFINWQVNASKYLDELKERGEPEKVEAAPSTESPADAVQSGSGQSSSPEVASAPYSLRIEKPHLPKFSGDVREFFVFRDDFKHLVESRYSSRDGITILRSCLQGKPLDLIRGIGTDYNAAWEQLELIYGDPRFVADAIIDDISKFRALKENEDSRFCELVHLVRRSYNILVSVGRQHDMDNNHMLASIERKLSQGDRKVWFRCQEKDEDPASLHMLLEWMANEMKARMRASAPLRSESRQGAVGFCAQKDTKPDKERKWVQTPSAKDRCWICHSSDHWIDQCKRFISKPASERLQIAKENRACFSCLKQAERGHLMATCNRRRQCPEMRQGQRCKFYHHPLLHLEWVPRQDDSLEQTQRGQVGVATVVAKESLLPIVLAEVLGCNGDMKEGNVLLDSGAQISLIRQELATELQLEGTPTTITICKIGDEQELLHTNVYKVLVRGKGEGGKAFTVSAIGIPCISEHVQAINLDDLARKFRIKRKDLHRSSGPVDILIGVDHTRFHCGETREVGNFIARKSRIGWVIFGATRGDRVHSSAVLHVKLAAPVDLTDFWSVETEGVRPEGCQCIESRLTRQEVIEEQVIRSSAHKIGKQWQIAYPWQRDPEMLPDNKWQAEKVLQSTEKRLARNPEHAKAYDQQIQEMEDMGFARKLSPQEMECHEGPVHYISHHAVVRAEKKSTPIRIVFNSSASFQGHSLNEYWMKGPDLLNSLPGVLLRFREKYIAICADISKMYHRVLIPESDQHVHRFLWRNMDVSRRPDVYIMKVVTFGDKPAAAMAQIALKMTAEQGESKYPEAANVLKRNVYMDDICDSVETLSKAETLTGDIDEVLSNGGFKVKGWLSNKPLHGDNKEGEMKLLEALAEEKVLGVVWDKKDDVFSYRVKFREGVMPSANEGESRLKLTKRKILSQVARVFDPIGFAAPIIARAKMGLQRLWQMGLGWDDPLPEKEQTEWTKLFEEMTLLNNVKLRRCLTPQDARGKPVLCIFSDASESAYGTCAYLRWRTDDNKYEVRFVAAKSKVAPLKTLTMPRLELQAAVVAARLYKAISEEIRLEIEKVVFFVDSMIVFHWIKSPARSFKAFVSSRVGEIQSLTDPSQWKHIPGTMNAADDVSRGVTVDKLAEVWKHGPSFLYTDESEWPVDEPEADQRAVDSEQRKSPAVFSVHETSELLECKKFSKWRKLLRVTAYVMRFVNILKSRIHKGSLPDEKTTLTTTELERAEMYWIKVAQERIKPHFKKGDFKVLTPFIDEEGVIRVGGRVGNMDISYEAKHPVLLPYDHGISLLITRYMHESGHHGVAATTARTRKRFWILKGHRLAKSVKHRCVVCRAAACQAEIQQMASLPSIRVAPFTPPFHFTSCDYFGPYHVKVSRNKKAKHYGVIFTCLNTRAVHLELAVDCSTQEFLQVLRRFFAIRGHPKVIMSDNGTQFVGAKRELREMVKGWDDVQLRDFCAEIGVEWQFTTPLAPHQNGCAEALVKSCKFALHKAVGSQCLTPFELYTCLVEIANLVNQRPVGRIPNDPDDGSYVSPNDMLLGRASRSVPQGPFRETENPRHRVEFVQRIVDSFWRRWSRDVLPLLVPSKKWNTERRNVRVGDVVMTAEANAVRGKWTIARVIQVYPGADGRVRNVQLKTAVGIYRRPVTKIAVIYPTEGYDESV